ncbi:MAG: precorrin-6Y C5,15-methyltransferase (decarboxylating) subunit CbiT [Methanobacteriaceae archaeon]|nr:precorrin-6Y C5,15-methyltransferase (decarboxylating) subunit CbiT [Methanobacteriaceae archaeon]
MKKNYKFIVSNDVPGPTKEEIRCLVMCKSEVSSSDVILEIGTGTGGLTTEFARKAKKVFSVDKNPKAISLAQANLKRMKLEHKVELIQGDALTVLDDIPQFDVLMIGGSSGDLSQIIKKGYKHLKTGGRIIITAILLETRFEAVNTLRELSMNPDIVDISISKGKIIERGTMMYAENPVAIIYSSKK